MIDRSLEDDSYDQRSTSSPILRELESLNVTWSAPGGEMGSMPIGNGDIAANVWVDGGGDVVFYISKSDSWNEQDRLLKIGRVRVTFSPPLPVSHFTQTLNLPTGEVRISAGTDRDKVAIRVWVDANASVIRLECVSVAPRRCRVTAEIWRTEDRPFHERGEHSEVGLERLGISPTEFADVPIGSAQLATDRIGWFHRNLSSVYRQTLESQHLGALLSEFPDPLLGRTFGAVISGTEMRTVSPLELESIEATSTHLVDVVAHTTVDRSPEEWLADISALTDDARAGSRADCREAHEKWWADFWNRSHIFITGDEDARSVTRGYALQRFMIAASSRGNMPPKFNGGLFTVQWPDATDPDYRRWGGNYWFQNNRWLNWPSLAAGDFDLMMPFFAMYLRALPLAQARTRLLLGHEGAFFPETMHFWGTPNGNDFHEFGAGDWTGWANPDGLACNPYIRYYWQGGIELTAMMLDFFDFTQDASFSRDYLMPIAEAILSFYDEHWPRDAGGKIRFDPTASLETWHVAVNDAPTIAGLRSVLPRLIALPMASQINRESWARMVTEIPELPIVHREDGPVLVPAQDFSGKANVENPELYAVFPYRLFGVGKPDLDLAERTFQIREERGQGCWTQNGVDAAILGRADEARANVVYNFTKDAAPQLFPGFWPPGYDWAPDLDNGGTAMMTLHEMLLQQVDGEILVAPAWPTGWDCTFKLHAPANTVVEGRIRDGDVVELRVTPESRRKDARQQPRR